MSEMDEIIREFLVESNEGLDQMDRDLVELEKTPDCKELLASIFRAVHTIKGTSGVLGFKRLEAVAHVGENLLSRLRDGKLRLSPQMATVLLAMVDVVRAKLLQIEANGCEAECDDSQIIAAVSDFLSAGPEESATTEKVSSPLIGEILVESGVHKSAINHALQQQSEGDPRRLGEILVSSGAAKPDMVLDALNKQTEPSSPSVSSNIRVDVGLLDKVMNLVGELVLARNQVESPHDGQEQDLAEHLPADPERSPFAECLRGEMKRALADAIAELPEKEQQVLSLYYFEELTMKEVGAVLGVGESRVSQIHSMALVRLRARLRQLQASALTGPVIAATAASEGSWTRF
jgi:RNA polymerase sigma factor (sigma-70 family)